MRIALLSALADPPGTGSSQGERAALRRFAGKTVLSHQIDCAGHLGCERVLCLMDGAGVEAAAARSYAERTGLRFDAVDSLPRLVAQLAADDEIVLIADGVLPDRTELVAGLAGRPAVLAFPVEPALEHGLERIDAVHGWSGVLRTRGDRAARLADMAADSDMGSSLLRIALQAGAPIVSLDEGLLESGKWQRRVERNATAAAQWRWMSGQVRLAPFSAPGSAVAERIGLRFAKGAGGTRWGRAPHAAAVVAGAAALAAAIWAWPAGGLMALLIGTIALRMAGVIERIDALGAPNRPDHRALATAHWLGDGLLIAIMAPSVVTVPGWLGWLLPLVLIALLRLAERTAPARVRAAFGDRISLIAAMLPIVLAGYATIATAALSVAVLAVLVWQACVPAKSITAD